MAKAPKAKPEEARTAAANAAPVTEPTTELAAAGAVGQATAENGQGAKSPSAVADEKAPVTLVITGPKQGRWRAKRHFGAEPVTIPLSDLTEDEVALLNGDPHLTIKMVDAPY